MGLDTIPDRSNGQPIDQTWFNIIRSVLNGDFVPRDSSGVVTDQSSSLGSTIYRWLYAFVSGLYIYNGSRSVKLEAPSGMVTDYTMKMPTGLPASSSKMWFVNSTGDSSLTLEPDNSTLEISGSTIRVKNSGVTRTKLAPLGQQISSSCGAFSFTGTGSGDVTNLTVTLTTTGRPIFVGLISDGSGNNSSVTGDLRLFRNSSQTSRFMPATNALPVSAFWTIEPIAAGTYTYQMSYVTSSSTITVSYAKLIAFEL